MKAKHVFFYICTGLMCTLPFNAQAVIIDGTFQAKVVGAEPVEGLWGDIRGTTVTGTYSYNTALFETKNVLRPNEVMYVNNSNTFLNISFTIAGHTFDVSHDYTDRLAQDEQTDIVKVQDANPGDNDHFWILDSVYLGDHSSGYVQTTADISLFDRTVDFISGVGLEQQFTWAASSEDEAGGHGNFSYVKELDGEYIYAFVHTQITGFTASVRQSSVPEPGSLVLLMTALLGVALLARYKPSS